MLLQQSRRCERTTQLRDPLGLDPITAEAAVAAVAAAPLPSSAEREPGMGVRDEEE